MTVATTRGLANERSSVFQDCATRPIVALMMVALFTTSLAFSAVLPGLPAILQRSGLGTGAIVWHTSMLTGIYMLAVFVFAPVWGRGSDRVGRRVVVVSGLLGMSIALLGFAFVHNIVAAYVARAFTGVCVAAVIVAATAEVGDVSGPDSRAHRFAALTSASLVGFLAGPSLSAWLSKPSWLAIFGQSQLYVPVIVAAVASGGAAIAVALGLPRGAARRPDSFEESHPTTFSLASAAPALLVFVVMFALASFAVAIALRGQQLLGWDATRIGLLFGECSVVMLVIQGVLFAFLVKHVPSALLVGSGISAMMIGLILMPLTADYDRILFLVVLISGGASVVVPMITFWTSADAGPSRGAALGTQTAASSLGQALGSGVVGLLFGLSASAPFWLATVLLGAGVVLLVSCRGVLKAKS